MMAMLKKGQVVGLLFIAVLSTMLLFEMGSTGDEPADRDLFPGLKKALPEIEQMTVTGPDGFVTIQRGSETGEWQVVEMSGYRAAFDKVSGLLRSLADLRWEEAKTSSPEHHGRLGVDENAIRVTLHKGGDTTFGLLIGKRADSRGHFVRRSGEDQVYLLAEPLAVSASPLEWADRIVINVDALDVGHVTLQTESGSLSGGRDEAGNFQLAGIPDGRELKYGTVADGLTRLLVNLRFDDVRPYQSGSFENASTAVLMLQSGAELSVRTTRIDGKPWLHIDTRDLRDWQYQVSEYTFGEFNKTMEDMLKEETEAEAQ